MDFEELMKRILDKPTLYIGGYSIIHIKMFMNGYIGCLIDHGMDCSNEVESLFTEFVCKQYHITVSRDWASIIQFFSSSEQNGFDNLVKLFGKFEEMRSKENAEHDSGDDPNRGPGDGSMKERFRRFRAIRHEGSGMEF